MRTPLLLLCLVAGLAASRHDLSPMRELQARLVSADGTIAAKVTETRHLSDYSLYVLETDHGPLCRTAEGQPVAAIPLSGHWTARADWAPGGVTFACVDGALGKCVVWGYRPWEPGMRDLHQSCVRMVRADYCGDGVGHTRDGTPIDVWDSFGILEPAQPQGMSPEAEWGPEGAIRIWRTRFAPAMAYVRRHCPERLDPGIRAAPLLVNASFPYSADGRQALAGTDATTRGE